MNHSIIFPSKGIHPQEIANGSDDKHNGSSSPFSPAGEKKVRPHHTSHLLCRAAQDPPSRARRARVHDLRRDREHYVDHNGPLQGGIEGDDDEGTDKMTRGKEKFVFRCQGAVAVINHSITISRLPVLSP